MTKLFCVRDKNAFVSGWQLSKQGIELNLIGNSYEKKVDFVLMRQKSNGKLCIKIED